MDDIQEAIQDAQYIGAMAHEAPRPTAQFKYPTTEQRDRFIEMKTRDKPDWLSFSSILAQPLGFHVFKLFVATEQCQAIAPKASLQIQFVQDVIEFKRICFQQQRIEGATSLWAKYSSKSIETRGQVPCTEAVFRPKRTGILDLKTYEQLRDPNTHLGVKASVSDRIQQTLDQLKFDSALDIRNVFDEVELLVVADLEARVYGEFQLQSKEFPRWLDFRCIQACPVGKPDFEVLRILGKGGFGLVYACTKRTTGTLYAYKEMDKVIIKSKKAQALCISERNILTKVNSPFIVCLKYAFQTKKKLVLVLDLLMGGNLAYHLRSETLFLEDQVKFWAAQIVCGLDHLHSTGFVYRDLKLENILLDEDGNCSISDLGLAIKVSPTLSGKCGTRGYWAPEMLVRGQDGKRLCYNHTVDWWSFGCVVYELLYGKCPFRTKSARQLHDDKQQAYDIATLEMEPDYDLQCFSPEAIKFLKALLNRDPKCRLGANGAAEVKATSFFSGIDWRAIESKTIQSPFRPGKHINAAAQSDIGSFDRSIVENVTWDEEDDIVYKGWEYTCGKAFQTEVIHFMEWERKEGREPPERKESSKCCVIL